MTNADSLKIRLSVMAGQFAIEIPGSTATITETLTLAASELDRLTRLNAELREYAHHESGCGFWLEDSICSCGLAQLLEKMK